jgi:hypothetical protein
MDKFLVQLKKKRPKMMKRQWFFHNAPMRTAAAVVKNWLPRRPRCRQTHLCLPDLNTAEFFFLFQRVREELAGIYNTPEGFRQSITEEEFSAAVCQWYKRCDKWIWIGGQYIKKR